MEKIKKYLEEKKISYHISENEIIVPYEIDDRKFHISIQMYEKWIKVRAKIVKNTQVPIEKYNDLMRELLIANHEFPEINYDISREGDIFSSADMGVNVIDYDNFFSEFYALPFAIKRFIEKIAPKFDVEVTGFA